MLEVFAFLFLSCYLLIDGKFGKTSSIKFYYLFTFILIILILIIPFFHQIATSKDGIRDERVSIVSQEEFQKIKPGSQNGNQTGQKDKPKVPAAPPVIQVFYNYLVPMIWWKIWKNLLSMANI